VVRPAHNWGALVDTPLPAAKEVINAAPCIGLWSTLGIHVSGAVHICCVDTAGQVVLGNVAAESIAEIWRGPALERLRRMHLEGDRCRIGPCDGCTVWYEAEGAQGGRSDV
jgi:radical SAM protein with 4Fe4S-binding SPASM domain